MNGSYKDQVTAEHDAFCIGAALKSALENNADRANYSVTLDAALEEAYGYLAEGLSNCRCMFAGMTGDARIEYLLQFSDDALNAMHSGGYYNDFTGELMQIDSLLRMAVHNTRNERDNHWLATQLANEIVGDQDSYSAVVAADTVVTPSYSLLVNGLKSAYGSYVNRWGIAYAVARELTAAGIDADSNAGFIGAVVMGLVDHGSALVTSGIEFSTITESN